jgi:hypothetical protein
MECARAVIARWNALDAAAGWKPLQPREAGLATGSDARPGGALLGTEESGAGEHSTAGWKGCAEDGMRGRAAGIAAVAARRGGENRGCGFAERSAAGVRGTAERAPREVDAYSAHIIVVEI